MVLNRYPILFANPQRKCKDNWNIACLDQISSEAEFAFLLGHEYAHYSLRHGELSCEKKYAKKKKRKTSIKELNEYNSFSQKNEMASDSLAMMLVCYTVS